MELQKFLMEHKDNWEELLTSEPYNLKVNRWGGYVSFKYSQIESDLSQKIVQEARGCLFREKNWKCVCRAFDKFFNYGETKASSIDWKTAKVFQKIDGSLIKIFYDEGQWYIVTNSGLNAFDANTGNVLYPTFGNLFTKGIEIIGFKDFKEFSKTLDPSYTYMFELVSPYTRVVIPYEDIKIYYLGQRRMDNFEEEYSPNNFIGFQFPKEYSVNNLNDIIQMAEDLSWDEEGYVVRDKYFNRIKVKSPAYVSAHYMRNNNVITDERLMEIILKGEIEEFICYAEEYAPKLFELQNKKITLQEEAEKVREILSTQFCFDSRKEYASIVNKISNPTIRQFCFSSLDWDEMTKDWSARKWVEKLNSR